MVLYPNKLPESERVCSGICKDNQRKTQSGYGKPCRKVKQRRGICRLHHLKKRSHET